MIDETQMPIAPKDAIKEKSAKLLIPLPLRTIYFQIFQCETPCIIYITLSCALLCFALLKLFVYIFLIWARKKNTFTNNALDNDIEVVTFNNSAFLTNLVRWKNQIIFLSHLFEKIEHKLGLATKISYHNKWNKRHNKKNIDWSPDYT